MDVIEQTSIHIDMATLATVNPRNTEWISPTSGLRFDSLPHSIQNPNICLCVRFRIDGAAQFESASIEVALIDPDGQEFWRAETECLMEPLAFDGVVYGRAHIRLQGVIFQAQGNYVALISNRGHAVHRTIFPCLLSLPES